MSFVALVMLLIAAVVAPTAGSAEAQPFVCEVQVSDDGQRVLKCTQGGDDQPADEDGEPLPDRGARGERAGSDAPDAVLWDRPEPVVDDDVEDEEVIDDTGEIELFADEDAPDDDEVLNAEVEANEAAVDDTAEDAGNATAALPVGGTDVERPDKSKDGAAPTPAVVDEAQANPGEAAAPLETPVEPEQSEPAEIDEPTDEVAASLPETATERVDRVRQSTDRLILGIWVALLLVGLAMFGIGRLRSDPDPELSGYFR